MRAARVKAVIVPSRQLITGAAVALAIATAWIALTAASGKAYHLAPVMAAAAPGFVVMAGRRAARPSALSVALTGLGAVGVGWLFVFAAGIEPTVTVLPRQPGGVPAEVVLGAVFGAALGALLTTQQRGARRRLREPFSGRTGRRDDGEPEGG